MTDTTPGREATAREGGAPLHFPAQNDPKCKSSDREAIACNHYGVCWQAGCPGNVGRQTTRSTTNLDDLLLCQMCRHLDHGDQPCPRCQHGHPLSGREDAAMTATEKNVCPPCAEGRHHACLTGARPTEPAWCACTINPDTGEDEAVDDE